MVPADSVVDRPAVIELLKAFGRGELKHAGVQAAPASQQRPQLERADSELQGTKRSFRRPPYFSADDIRTGMTYATEATRLAEANADEYKRLKKEKAEKLAKKESSELRSTTDTDSKDPVKLTRSNTKT